MQRCVLALVSAWVLLLISLTPAYAKGPPDKATISGPGLAGEITITNPTMLNELGFYSFEQVEENNRRGIEAPPNVSEGYLITRYVANPGGKTFRAWDKLHYYPNAVDGRGVIFLDGLIGDAYSEFDGRWFRASASGDAMLRKLLTEQGVQVDQLLPATGYAAPPIGWFALAGVSLLLLGALLRQRSIAYA